jgi:hypothetical protein
MALEVIHRDFAGANLFQAQTVRIVRDALDPHPMLTEVGAEKSRRKAAIHAEGRGRGDNGAAAWTVHDC